MCPFGHRLLNLLHRLPGSLYSMRYPDQVTFWPGATTTKGVTVTPQQYVCTYQTEFSINLYRRELVFAGFKFAMRQDLEFSVEFASKTGTADTIDLMIYRSLQIYTISFHVILMSTGLEWLWTESGCKYACIQTMSQWVSILLTPVRRNKFLP